MSNPVDFTLEKIKRGELKDAEPKHILSIVKERMDQDNSTYSDGVIVLRYDSERDDFMLDGFFKDKIKPSHLTGMLDDLKFKLQYESFFGVPDDQ